MLKERIANMQKGRKQVASIWNERRQKHKRVEPKLPAPTRIVESMSKHHISWDDLAKMMKRNGFSDERTRDAIRSMRTKIASNEVVVFASIDSKGTIETRVQPKSQQQKPILTNELES